MVIAWVAGDAGKLAYYSLSYAPNELEVAACVQLATDLGVLSQMILIYPNKEIQQSYSKAFLLVRQWTHKALN